MLFSKASGRIGAFLTAVGILAGALCAPARAQSDSWQFALTPFFWAAGISGKIKSGPASGTDIDVSFFDIFENLSFWPPPVMLAGEARYGRFGITMDILFLQVVNDLQTRGVLFSGGQVKMNTLEWTVAGYWRVVDDPRVKLDAGGGFRLWHLKTKARLDPGQLPGTSATISETFIDPIIAMRATIGITDAWSISAIGDIGGFGISSKLTWQAMATINYQMTSWAQTRLGWRYLAVNRDKINVALSGPIIGATFRF